MHEMTRKTCAVGRATGWLTLLTLTGSVAWFTGEPLRVPGAGLANWLAWMEARGPDGAALDVGRVAVLAVVAYLVVVTLAGGAARALGQVSVTAWLDRWTLPMVRRVLAGGTAAAMVATLAATPVASAGSLPSSTGARLTVVSPSPPTTPSAAPVMRAGTVVAPTDPGPQPSVTSEAPATPVERVLVPGDHLWSVAAEVVAGQLGRSPNEGEVARYWARLVAANVDRLADPANPDLVFAGDTVVLPPAA